MLEEASRSFIRRTTSSFHVTRTLIIPVGNTLDINYIHNRAKRLTTTGDGFLRNQGVGTWEDNLAGFLADLNTNIWYDSNGVIEYNYRNGTPFVRSLGGAFDDCQQPAELPLRS